MQATKTIDERFLAALKSSNSQDLTDCLAQGYSPEAFEEKRARRSALQVAILEGQIESVKTLIAAGASPIERGSGTAPLFMAIEKGLIGVVRILLEAGVSPVGTTLDAWSGPLCKVASAANNRIELAATMIEFGGDLNPPDAEQPLE